MPIIIYKVDQSPPARAAIMMAEILKLKYEARDVNIYGGEHLSPEYLEKNPQHTVPLLEDGDFCLADSHAIITYLVSKYGADKRAELYPSDMAIRATIDHRLYFDASVLFPTGKAVINALVREKATEINEKHFADMNEVYDILERYLQKTKYIASNHFTLADVSCVATVSTMNVFVPIDKKYEKLLAWLDRLKDEEWYKKINEPGLKLNVEFVKDAIEKNKA